MSAYMYDGINSDAAGIARLNPLYVAGYLDGAYAWTAAEWALFPRSVKVQVVITASANEGDVLDVETGDASPGQTAGWIQMRKAAGYYRPTIYCNLSTVAAVRTGTGKYVLGEDYDLWVADYDNSTAEVYAGAVAKQYKTTSGDDVSIVFDTAWPHRKAPQNAPAVVEGLSVSPYATFTDFGWAKSAGATSYDFQLVSGNTQIDRQTVTGTSIHNVPTVQGTKYYFRVSAKSASGTAPFSAEKTFTTPADPDMFPAPTGLHMSNQVGRTFTWNAVSSAVGKPSGYTVQVLDINGHTFSETTVTGTEATVNLSSPGQYTILVWANGGKDAPPHASLPVSV
jgi:hypothetical protein